MILGNQLRLVRQDARYLVPDFAVAVVVDLRHCQSKALLRSRPGHRRSERHWWKSAVSRVRGVESIEIQCLRLGTLAIVSAGCISGLPVVIKENTTISKTRLSSRYDSISHITEFIKTYT